MTDREAKRLEKLLYYVLGRRPDEFGLFPVNGLVKLKDLLKALNEIDGFKNIKAKQIRDFFAIFKPERLVYLEEEQLLGVRKEFADPHVYKTVFEAHPPPRLFTPVRPRAWIKVAEEGLAAEKIILTPEEDLAARMARRRGALVIEVDTRKAMQEGAVFERYLEKIFLSTWIPASALRGPKVDEAFRTRYAPKPKEKPQEERPAQEIVIPEKAVPFRKLTKGRKKDPAWKRERRRRHRER